MPLFPTAKSNLARVKTYQPGKPIEEVQREYRVKSAIKMASNENALGASPKAVKAMTKVLKNVFRYPDGGCFYLRKKLAKFLKVSEDNLIFGNGSDEILVLAVRALIGPGDEVIIANPTFLIYEIATQVESGAVIKVPMKDFRYDLNGFLQKLTPRTKLIFIANPDNPVGTYINDKRFAEFMARVPGNVVVVLDEAYFEFAREAKDYPDGISYLSKYKNLIVSRTFSKAYGLAGLRVGYGVSSPDLIQTLSKVREPFNVNLLAQEAALAALDDRAFLAKSVKLVREGRKFLAAELQKLGFQVVPTVTNFILFDLKSDANQVYESLLKKGIIVRSMSAWGLPTFMRVTIGKKADNKKFIQTLKEILK